MKSNFINVWVRVFLEGIIFGLFSLMGYLIRSPLTVGYDEKIVAVLMYALFLFAETFMFCILIGLKTEPTINTIVKALLICIVAAFAFAFIYDLCERFFALVVIVCLPEIATCTLVPMYVFEVDSSNQIKKNFIRIELITALLSILFLMLLCLDGIKYSGFFSSGTSIYDLWVRDAFKPIDLILSSVAILNGIVLLVIQTKRRDVDSKKAKAIPRMIATLGFLALIFVLRMITFPDGSLAFHEESKVLEWNRQIEDSPFSSVQMTKVYVQKSGNPKYIGLGGKYHVVVFDSTMTDEIVQFSTVTGVSNLGEIEQEHFISELANEVVLIREADGWKAFYTQKLKNEEKNDLLTEAIWDGVDHGNMLMAVYASEYLKKNDFVEFQKRMSRWSQALFTEKETAKADLYSWISIIEWANKQSISNDTIP